MHKVINEMNAKISRGHSKPEITPPPRMTICVLAYGDYYHFVRRCLLSVLCRLPRAQYRLVVGANAVCEPTRIFLEALREQGAIDHLVLSEKNLEKCPMMRQLFGHVQTEYVWWLDDDCQIMNGAALSARLSAADHASCRTAIWGEMTFFAGAERFGYGTNIARYIRETPWFKQVPPPQGDKWFFITGACFFVRTSVLQALDWPDRSLLRPADDVFLAEAIRQQGWRLQNIGTASVSVNRGPRRNVGQEIKQMIRQTIYYDTIADKFPADNTPNRILRLTEHMPDSNSL